MDSEVGSAQRHHAAAVLTEAPRRRQEARRDRSRSRSPAGVDDGSDAHDFSPEEEAEGSDAEEDEVVIDRFLQAVSAVQRDLQPPQRTPQSINRWKRLPSRQPPILSAADNRLGVKAARVFVCDGCGNIARFSSQKRNTPYHRIECDFAGSYVHSSWTDIPGSLQRRAWEERLIDASWFCTQFCGAAMTGGDAQQRLARTQAWQERGRRYRQRRRA